MALVLLVATATTPKEEFSDCPQGMRTSNVPLQTLEFTSEDVEKLQKVVVGVA